MAKILRLSDRIKLKIDEVTFTLAPLSKAQKLDLANCTKMQDGNEVFELGKAQFLYVKYALKDIDGVETYGGDPYELDFEGDYLTDDCVTEIFCLEQKEKLTNSAWQILNGIKDLVDPSTGEPFEGVSLEVKPKKS